MNTLHDDILKAQAEQILHLASVTGQDDLIQKAFESQIEKGGKRAILGETRVWSGVTYQKTKDGWIEQKKKKESERDEIEFEDDKDADSQEDYESMNPSKHRLEVERDFEEQKKKNQPKHEDFDSLKTMDEMMSYFKEKYGERYIEENLTDHEKKRFWGESKEGISAEKVEQAKNWVESFKRQDKKQVAESWHNAFSGKVHSEGSELPKSWLIYDLIKQKFGKEIADHVTSKKKPKFDIDAYNKSYENTSKPYKQY